MRKGTVWTMLFLLVSGYSSVSWNYENLEKGFLVPSLSPHIQKEKQMDF